MPLLESLVVTTYSACTAALATSDNNPVVVPWSEQDRKEFAERHAKLSKDLEIALDRAASSEQLVESQKENILELNARIIGLNTEMTGTNMKRNVMRESAAKAQEEKGQVQEEIENLRQELEGNKRTHQQAVSELQGALKELQEAPERGDFTKFFNTPSLYTHARLVNKAKTL